MGPRVVPLSRCPIALPKHCTAAWAPPWPGPHPSREERRALEEKYEKLYTPLYDRRRDVINGAAEAPENETGAREAPSPLCGLGGREARVRPAREGGWRV